MDGAKAAARLMQVLNGRPPTKLFNGVVFKLGAHRTSTGYYSLGQLLVAWQAVEKHRSIILIKNKCTYDSQTSNRCSCVALRLAHVKAPAVCTKDLPVTRRLS